MNKLPPLPSDVEIRRLLREHVEGFHNEHFVDWEWVGEAVKDCPERPATYEETFEAIWCNIRDDKPHEYFYGSPLGRVPFEVIDWQFEKLAQEMGVKWPEGSEA